MTPISSRFPGAWRALALAFPLAVLPAMAAEYVTTRSEGRVRKGYPLKVPEGAFVELVQLGGYNGFVPNLRLKFADGRTYDNLLIWNRTHHGFKFAGLSQIEFTGAKDHAILWKITPAADFGRKGAEYRTVIPGLPTVVAGAGYQVPEGRAVRILQTIPHGSDETESNWASVRLDSSIPGLSAGGFIRTPSEPFPFLTQYLCDTFTLVEITSLEAGASVTVTVEQSDDFRQWDPLRSFEVEASVAKRFFRTTIER